MAYNAWQTLFSSTSRTTSVDTGAVDNLSGSGVVVLLNVSSIAGSLTPTIYGYDPVSEATYTLLTGAAVSSAGLYPYRVYPGITPVPNEAASDVVPRYWGLSVAAGTTDSNTYSASCSIIE